jgi:hypothetical protein
MPTFNLKTGSTMPPKTTTTPPPAKVKNAGRIIINAKEIHNATAIEITPGGNGQYAVTIRQVLTDQTPQMFREDYQGKLHIVYLHPALVDLRLQGTFLDFGVQDEKGECILSLYFRAQQEEAAIVSAPKPQISLV